MRGKLGFAQTLMFGRTGRALIHPFTARQYEPGARAKAPLSTELKEVIPWWIAQLARTRPRMVSTRARSPVLVYTDACGEGHIGAAIVIDGTRYYHLTHVPAWFLRAKVGIFELELAACVFGLVLASLYAPGRPVLLCCDNMGSRGAVVRGSCATVIGRMVASVFWNVAAHFPCAVRVDYVPSGLNVADPPSRACECLPVEERAKDVSAGAPSLFRHLLSSRHALAASQFQLDISAIAIQNGRSCTALNTPKSINLSSVFCFGG